MWIKICANTTLEDAQLAVDLGADAIGFVFAESARRVTAQQASKITAGLVGAPVERIGVFSTTDFNAIRSVVDVAGLTGVQLHGGLRLELIDALRAEFGGRISITQTLHWAVGSEAELATAAELRRQMKTLRLEDGADRVLVDAKAGKMLGGTGKSFDWNAGKTLFQAAVCMIVAGGLTPENVGEAVRVLWPWGVDVASGVERVPGRKDPERLRLFLERARTAGCGS